MTHFKKKFSIGNLDLKNNIIYAPLAGYTDYSFRKITRLFNPGLIFCEMVKMEALIRKKSENLLHFEPDMHPIGAQLCGANPKIAKEAAKIIEDLGFDILDLNCGCPVHKVVKDGSGSALLKTPELIGDLITEMSAAVKIPVTAKIRIGWDSNSINAAQITRVAEEAGAKAITVHGRTKTQGYRGKSNWDYIKACKDVAKNILVIGNGGLYTFEDVRSMFELTHCDGVMIARGMLSEPWLAEDIEYNFCEKSINRAPLFKKNIFLKHIDNILEDQIDKKTLYEIRRIGAWYLRGQKGIKSLRIQINQASNAKEAIDFIKSFDWEE